MESCNDVYLMLNFSLDASNMLSNNWLGLNAADFDQTSLIADIYSCNAADFIGVIKRHV